MTTLHPSSSLSSSKETTLHCTNHLSIVLNHVINNPIDPYINKNSRQTTIKIRQLLTDLKFSCNKESSDIFLRKLKGYAVEQLYKKNISSIPKSLQLPAATQATLLLALKFGNSVISQDSFRLELTEDQIASIQEIIRKQPPFKFPTANNIKNRITCYLNREIDSPNSSALISLFSDDHLETIFQKIQSQEATSTPDLLKILISLNLDKLYKNQKLRDNLLNKLQGYVFYRHFFNLIPAIPRSLQLPSKTVAKTLRLILQQLPPLPTHRSSFKVELTPAQLSTIFNQLSSRTQKLGSKFITQCISLYFDRKSSNPQPIPSFLKLSQESLDYLQEIFMCNGISFDDYISFIEEKPTPSPSAFKFLQEHARNLPLTDASILFNLCINENPPPVISDNTI